MGKNWKPKSANRNGNGGGGNNKPQQQQKKTSTRMMLQAFVAGQKPDHGIEEVFEAFCDCARLIFLEEEILPRDSGRARGLTSMPASQS